MQKLTSLTMAQDLIVFSRLEHVLLLEMEWLQLFFFHNPFVKISQLFSHLVIIFIWIIRLFVLIDVMFLCSFEEVVKIIKPEEHHSLDVFSFPRFQELDLIFRFI